MQKAKCIWLFFCCPLFLWTMKWFFNLVPKVVFWCIFFPRVWRRSAQHYAISLHVHLCFIFKLPMKWIHFIHQRTPNIFVCLLQNDSTFQLSIAYNIQRSNDTPKIHLHMSIWRKQRMKMKIQNWNPYAETFVLPSPFESAP